MKEKLRDTISFRYDSKQLTAGRALAELHDLLNVRNGMIGTPEPSREWKWFEDLDSKHQDELIDHARTEGLALTAAHIRWTVSRSFDLFGVEREVILDQTPGPDAEEEKPLSEWLLDLHEEQARSRRARLEACDRDNSFDPATEAAKRDLQAQMDKIKRRSAK